MPSVPARLSEILGALTLATDTAAGLGTESAMKVCIVATETGRALGLGGDGLRAVYNAAILRFLGCTAFAHETARLHSGGDDAAALRALSLADLGRPQSVLAAALRGLASSGTPAARVTALLHFASDRRLPQKLATAHCQLAAYLAGELAMPGDVLMALGQMYERFDGKGEPLGLRGEELTIAARLIHLGFRVVAHHTLLGPGEALETVTSRAGTELDPRVARAFSGIAPALFEKLAAPSVRETFLAAEPGPITTLDGGGLLRACFAFATYADMKSPYTLGHSPAVAVLSAGAASLLGMEEDVQTRIEIAALLHDLGRVSVPNGIWDKRDPLTAAERKRVEQHSYETEHMLEQSAVLAEFSQLAGMHHERLDGSGYHRRLSGANLIPLGAAVIAAADFYRSKVEDRPYRTALEPSEAAAQLVRLASEGRIDRRAAEAVVEAAGQRARDVRPLLPAELTEREIEVLVLVAKGLTNKQAAARLVISPRTVQNHLASVFVKTGVSNRAAAALFASRHRLIE